MKFLVAYASKEGQTRKIARFLADHLTENGHSVELSALKDSDGLELTRFDRIILAAPLHAGTYPRAFFDFVEREHATLSEKPSLFLSVSLAAAGHDAEDWRQIDHIAKDFEAATQWSPDRMEQIAGAYRPSQYNIFERFIMRRIMAEKDPDADPGTDKEYTDWDRLRGVLTEWVAS